MLLLATKVWEQRQLGEIGTTYSGLSGKNKSDFEKGNSNFVTFLEVLNNPILKNIDLTNKVEIKENEHQNKVKRNDILFNTSSETPEEVATSTVVDVNQSNLYLNSFCFGFRPNVKFSNYYIGYYLRSNHFRNRVFCLAQGISRYNISKKSLIKLKLSLPKLEEQDKIGKIFNQVELLLTLYERKLKLLSQVKKYFLDNLFAEKEYPNLRFKGFTDAWEKIKLKDTQTTLTDGNYANLYPKPADMTDADKGIPFLTGGNLKNGILDLENAKYITKEKHSQLKSGHLEEDDIVIAVRGSLGELGYVTKQNIDWNINSQLAIIRTSKNELIGKFLLYFFLSSKGKSKLLSRQTGTALKQLPLQQLKTIVVPKTLLLEQQKISNILKTIDKTISFYKGKQQHFAEIKNTLLNTMFI